MGNQNRARANAVFSIGVWTAHNEVIVPSHQNPGNVDLCLESRIANGAAHREMINHLRRERAGGPARRGFLFVLTEVSQAGGLFFARFGNHRSGGALHGATQLVAWTHLANHLARGTRASSKSAQGPAFTSHSKEKPDGDRDYLLDAFADSLCGAFFCNTRTRCCPYSGIEAFPPSTISLAVILRP
jgi:hypothetical protein